MIKFLPSYVGSKAYWISDLLFLKNRNIAELFCGSAVISANLAKKAYLGDIDPMLYKILSNYSDLIEMETFTDKDYFENRKKDDWWRYVY